VTDHHSIRRPLSARTRFEIFKRDGFQCRYCGNRIPAVILEVDHVIPVCDGGTDDPVNLVTACWQCNRGKAGVSLETVLLGENPTERAAWIQAREAQLREYNAVIAAERERCEDQAQEIVAAFCDLTGYDYMLRSDYLWVVKALETTPLEVVRDKLHAAYRNDVPKRSLMRYVKTCVRRWHEEGV
jgi:hypothetical protein